MQTRRFAFRHVGFTLVELLVILAIVGLLCALLLPAVQHAREAARSMGCRNNLHQIGIGMQSYHATHGTFPPGGIEPRTWQNRTGRQMAWSAMILPFMEQQPVYDRIDFGRAFDAPENAAAAAVILEVYTCPSTPGRRVLREGRGPCQYGGMYGERIMSPNSPPKGPMLYDRAIGLHEIPDGASSTILIGEDSQFSDGQWINGRNVFDQAFPINRAPAFENDLRSEHPGGVNVGLADGSARFLAETIENRVLAALCTRAGGEVVGSAW